MPREWIADDVDQAGVVVGSVGRGALPTGECDRDCRPSSLSSMDPSTHSRAAVLTPAGSRRSARSATHVCGHRLGMTRGFSANMARQRLQVGPVEAADAQAIDSPGSSRFRWRNDSGCGNGTQRRRRPAARPHGTVAAPGEHLGPVGMALRHPRYLVTVRTHPDAVDGVRTVASGASCVANDRLRHERSAARLARRRGQAGRIAAWQTLTIRLCCAGRRTAIALQAMTRWPCVRESLRLRRVISELGHVIVHAHVD